MLEKIVHLLYTSIKQFINLQMNIYLNCAPSTVVAYSLHVLRAAKSFTLEIETAGIMQARQYKGSNERLTATYPIAHVA